MKSIDWEALRKAAIEARKHAYAPYSGFPVGAAILANGRIFAGCNIENASHPVGVCAERVALSAAVTAGCRSIEAVVVAAIKPVTPCGMCRQALAEFNPKVPIRMIGGEAETKATLGQLLPRPFAKVGKPGKPLRKSPA